jgi:hypothetical protein
MPMPPYLCRAAAAVAALTPSFAVHAHPGHGPLSQAAHGHATDVWGFVVIGALAAAAVWFGRGK